MSDYRKDARELAVEFAREYKAAILDRFQSYGETTDPDEYSDSWLMESAEEPASSPADCVELLDELDEYEETDEGLWIGAKSWRDILRAIAYYTYQNAAGAFARDLLAELVSELELRQSEYKDGQDHTNTQDRENYTEEDALSDTFDSFVEGWA